MSGVLTSVDRAVGYDKDLFATATVTETSAGTSPVRLPDAANGYLFLLSVSGTATEAGDTLDVFVQTSPRDSLWLDVVAFTQVAGDDGSAAYIAKISASAAESMFSPGSALSAGSVRNLIGNEWRIRYVVTDSATDNASFTFGVTGIPM